MKLDVNDITGTEADVVFNAPISEFNFSVDELVLKKEVQVVTRIRKINNKILIKGTIETQVDLECSRCLEHFPYSIGENFQVVFEPFSSDIQEEEMELEKEDLDIGFYKEGIIDLTEVVREQIILAVPMIPICNEDCKGLCPYCGQNLNQCKCVCVGKTIDPRWSKLQDLVSKKTVPSRRFKEE